MYRIELDSRFIGETALESADPPMGVVSGSIRFASDDCPYRLFKDYCGARGIPLNQDEEEIGLIDTQGVDGLKIFRSDGVEIVGVADASVSGFADDGYTITVLGISYPFYQEEFPHHTEAYDQQFAKPESNHHYDALNDYGLGHGTTPTSIGAGFLKTIIHMLRRNKNKQNKAEMATPRKPSD